MRLTFPDQASAAGDPLPEYGSPPVVETSVGIQFEGLSGYKSLSASSFRKRIAAKFPQVEEYAPLDPAFETFGPGDGQVAQVQFQLVAGAIQPRFFFVSNDGGELVQLQGDRLFYNWRKSESGATYPRYTHVRGELEAHLRHLEDWAASEELGKIAPTQCEAVYVNRIQLADAGGLACGLSFIFPWLNGLMGTTEDGAFVFRRRLNDESGEPVARLHVALRYGTDAENSREAQLTLHVRGRPSERSIAGCLDMIDAEREVIVRTFTEITSEQAHTILGEETVSLQEMEYADTAPAAWPLGQRRWEAPAAPQRQRPALVGRSVAEPAWKASVEARLRKLLTYKAGWDGYNGKPPRPSAIIFARDILSSAMAPTVPSPSIVPLSGGGLQLEWHVGGLDVELAIYAPFEAELSAEFADGRAPIEEVALSANFSLLGELLAELG